MEISTLSAHQMAHGGVVAHTSSWTPAACELEESSPLSRVLTSLGSARDHGSELPDGWREQGDKVVYVLTDPTAGTPPGTGAVQKYWNRGLPLIASVHRCSGTSDRCSRRCRVTRASCCGSSSKTLRRPGRRLLRQRHTQPY